MKKIILFAAILMALSLASCEKTCKCTVTTSGAASGAGSATDVQHYTTHTSGSCSSLNTEGSDSGGWWSTHSVTRCVNA